MLDQTTGQQGASPDNFNLDQAVRDRYSGAAQEREEALCCPVDYDPQYLKLIPQEIIDRDYGCGDPSRHLNPGDTVLDLGSGGGKICYIAAQVVGSNGHVIGVDYNQEMLGLARRYQSEVAEKLGYANVEFRRGRIEDLKLSLDLLESELATDPVQDAQGWIELNEKAEALRKQQPLVEDNSVDVVVSNCVLNLVSKEKRQQLFSEIFRVLKPGGRAVISDITCDEIVPKSLQENAELWSGCISGAFEESEYLEAFRSAELSSIEILERQEKPWTVVEGIEFRSMTVRAWKPLQEKCLDRRQAVMYRGPFASVQLDSGNHLIRGKRMAVCDRTYRELTSAPFNDQVMAIDPNVPVPLESAVESDCPDGAIRSASETKQGAEVVTLPISESCCSPGSDCC